MRTARTLALFILAVGPAFAQKASSPIVYGTRTGTKYHRANCQYLRQSKIKLTLKQAKERGLSPCSVCSPPK